MGRTNFENLRVYKLSEKLAAVIWSTVRHWDNFSRDTLGKQLVRSAAALEQILPKAQDVTAIPTTDAFVTSLAVRTTKQNTGYDRHLGEIFSALKKLNN